MANPKKMKGTVSEIKSYGNNVYQVYISFERKVPQIKAGQFLHLALDDFDPTRGFWPESRVFSICYIGDDRKSVSIVYSVKGKFTKRMKEELGKNRSVWIKLPYGDFIVKDHDQNIVLIAGGTGISPFIPYIAGCSFKSPVKIYYGINNPDLMIFNNELQTALNSDSGFELFLSIENNQEKVLSGKVTYYENVLSIERIYNENKKNDSIFYISGPPIMIESFKEYLLSSGVNVDNIKIDEWG